jgi:transposase-like protein
MPKKSEVSVSQRCEAVLALLRREEPAVQLARRYGVSEPTLYRWRDEFLAGGEAALKHGAKGVDPQQREVQQLRKQLEEREQIIGELTVANKFLKKLSAPSG